MIKFENWDNTLLSSLLDNINYIIANLPEDGVYYDIGANTGLLTEKIIEERPDITCYLFEPVKEYYDYIKERFKGNDKVIAFNFALIHDNGSALICKHDNNLGYNTMSFISEYGSKEEIICRTLSDVVEEYNIPKANLMKVDVEQSEYFLIEGCKKLFNTGVIPDIILMEIGVGVDHPGWPKEKEMIEYLFSLGYKKFDYERNDTYDAIFRK